MKEELLGIFEKLPPSVKAIVGAMLSLQLPWNFRLKNGKRTPWRLVETIRRSSRKCGLYSPHTRKFQRIFWIYLLSREFSTPRSLPTDRFGRRP